MPLTGPEKFTIESYDQIAEIRQRSLTTNTNFWLPEFVTLINDCPQKPVFLDLGCGDGRDATLYQSIIGNLDNYIGLDISSGMIASVADRNLDHCPLVQADMYNLPIKSESLDLVWSTASLIHTPRKQIGEQLSEIHRCLKIDGKAFFSVRYGEGETWLLGRHFQDRRYFVYWVEDNFTQVLQNSGFKVESVWVDTTKDNRGVPWLCVFASKPSL